MGKGSCLYGTFFSFSHSVFYPLENIPFSSNLKLSSAKFLSLEESKICLVGKGYSLANDKTLVLSKLKAFALADKFTEVIVIVPGKSRKSLLLEKGENAIIFSFSHTVFESPLFQGNLMPGFCGTELSLEKGQLKEIFTCRSSRLALSPVRISTKTRNMS